jgi:heterodisulfide reductase subunit A
MKLRYENTYLGEIFDEEFDLAVLAAGIVPSKNLDIKNMLKLATSPDGFLAESHPKLRPVETFINGVYICGVAQGPKDIPDTVAQASAAASRVSCLLTKGTVSIEPITAEIDQELCSGCGICKQVCFYDAIEFEVKKGKKRSRVKEFDCRGCGVCSAACPSGVITMKHFTDDQLRAEIEAMLPSGR